MNAECFEDNLLGLAEFIRDCWFEGMRIIFCYPVDKKEKFEDEFEDEFEEEEYNGLEEEEYNGLEEEHLEFDWDHV
jgi:hypothetical protein